MTAQERKLQEMARDLFKSMWSEAQGAVSSTEKQVAAFVDRLVERGGASREEARRVGEDALQRLHKSGDEMSRFLDKRLETMSRLLRLPTRSEVDDLHKRVERVAKRIERLSAKIQ
jgi:polyhydroxyalkanoate synthesis regulator phasin